MNDLGYRCDRVAMSKAKEQRAESLRDRRLREARDMPAIAWQAEHDVDGAPALVPVARQTTDTTGRVGVPVARRQTPLDVMLKRGTIDDGQYEAGVQFALMYVEARFESVQGCDLSREHGAGWRDVSASILDCRRRVSEILALLGGSGSVNGQAACQVVGQDISIKDFCNNMKLRRNSPINPHRAAGLVEGVLTVLAARFGTTRYAENSRADRTDDVWRVPA